MSKGFFKGLIAASAMVMAAGMAQAGALDIDTLKSVAPPSDDHPLDPLISGYEFRATETQALQDGDFDNPGFLWVDNGEELWSTVAGTKNKSCAECHGDASDSMKGVRAAMPKWNEAKGKPVNLEQQINICLTEQMGAEAWKFDSRSMLSMNAYVGLQSRGMPVAVKTDGPMSDWFSKGEKLYYARNGQLDMACSNCHEDNFGNRIRSDLLSQGHTNGFPVYRLKWQKPGSIHRRFKGCMKQVRAKPYKVGGDEFLALELYVAWRGTGMAVETPSVRN